MNLEENSKKKKMNLEEVWEKVKKGEYFITADFDFKGTEDLDKALGMGGKEVVLLEEDVEEEE
jgi:hypothetical protein